ncbi:hypothetical protein ACLB2K_039461 [Fragaria x ananassa]
MALCKRQMVLAVVGLVFVLCLDLSLVCASGEAHVHSHKCSHGHGHGHEHQGQSLVGSKLLPEELAEEEDMRLYGFGIQHDHDHSHGHEHFGALQLSVTGLWIHSLGCSLLVSMASLICLIILPVIFLQGKPSKAVVDSLALFGAGAMLGDAFLHQLPHAFGGGHSHSHDDHVGHDHHDHSEHEHSHAHSLEDLSVGIAVLAGIVLFLLVEKIVRYVEEHSGGTNAWGHGHHHHHHSKKLKDDNDSHDDLLSESSTGMDGRKPNVSSEGKEENSRSDSQLRKRNTTTGDRDNKHDVDAADDLSHDAKSLDGEPARKPNSLVFGYLNLFSDGVHNFTDGMALGSAFLLHGTVGGWSRTLFLLAHEIPQEVGDFGILVRSGFSVSKALFFNFLSALVALVGTAMALLIGQDPGQSSLMEVKRALRGFTAGGFIYIAVAGVLAEMNNNGNSSLKSTAMQLTSLILGMSVALCISLYE